MVRCWLILLCGALLAACSAPDTGSIRFGLATAPTNLDPRFATDATSERINRLLYARLVDFDEQARPVPALATWEILSERHYRFRLGEAGRLFHDGSRLDAGDVAATYQSILDPETASPHRGTLAMIERIEVVDADTLDFFLNRADVLFPGYLSIGILPAAGIEAAAAFHHHPVGSGPFRLHDWPESGRLELVRISDRQVFVFEQVHDPTMRVLKLMRGEVDILQNDLPPELLSYLAKRPGINVKKHVGSNFSYLGFQLQDEDTGKWEVRRAIALAIDRQAIIRHIFRGAARPASALLLPEHWAGNAQLDSIETDLDMARALLAQAGYGAANTLRISYKTSSDPFRVRIATILQQQLAQAGIEVDVQSYDWGTFYGDIKAGRFQMYSLAWVGVKSPDIFRYAFHSQSLPPSGANRGRLDDAQVDQMIEQAMLATDTEQQAAIYAGLQARLLERLVYVPLWYEDQYFAVRDDVSGYRLATDGNYDALLATIRR
ncbi:MAG: ABC transporter substrate-binding protein [Gammaproteobacteria bacterium]|nr:MAG: ABC transporter substrate-binding protein [Gammaproteobacteria bacterium]